MSLENVFAVRNPAECWMQVDHILGTYLRRIQNQGDAWASDPYYERNPARREQIVVDAWVALVGATAMLAQQMRLRGYPADAMQVQELCDFIIDEDVREHSVRERLTTMHHKFHPPKHHHIGA